MLWIDQCILSTMMHIEMFYGIITLQTGVSRFRRGFLNVQIACRGRHQPRQKGWQNTAANDSNYGRLAAVA